MKRLSFVVLTGCVLGLGLRVYAQAPSPQKSAPTMAVSHAAATIDESETALVKQYCATCHNDRNKNNAGGLSLQAFDADKVGHDAQVAEVAEKMIRKLRAGMMPPPQARRPEGAVLASFAASMESRLDAAAALNPNPGRRPF